MQYFAGLDVSMEETHVCVVTRNGAVIHNAKVPSTPADIAAELARLPRCRRQYLNRGGLLSSYLLRYWALARINLSPFILPLTFSTWGNGRWLFPASR